MLRFLNPFFNNPGIFFTPFVPVLSICGIIYASLIVFRQKDLKRVIAYFFIAYINLIVIDIFIFFVFLYYINLFRYFVFIRIY